MRVIATLPVLLAFALQLPGNAGGARTGRRGTADESLRGLTGVSVVIDDVGTRIHPVGVEGDTPSPAQVKALAEAQLRKAGVAVLDGEGGAGPALHITLVAHKDSDGYNHYVLRLRLTQEVTLPRAPAVKVTATTWETGAMAYGAGPAFFEGRICYVVGAFIEAYNEANGRAQKPRRSADLELLDPCRP